LADLLAAVERDGVALNWMLTPGPPVAVPVIFATAVQYTGGAVCLLVTQPEELDQLHRAFAGCRPGLAAAVASKLPSTGDDPLRAVMEEVGWLNSELSANQRELARTNSRLARTNAEMQRMLGGAAHDLRSPLGVISAYSEVLESVMADRLAPREREMLESIRTATAFMLRLLDDTLDYAKIDSGTLTLAAADTDLADLVRTTAALQQVVAEQSGRGIVLTVSDDLPRLAIDPDKIRQVLNNLLANAIRHARAEGPIRVEVARRAGEAVVAVTDDGAGIPEADQARLFQPFVQLRGEAGGGAGLGLAICRRIAEAYGGRMSVESAPSAGATFRLHLPLA
jgi:signal transduction histidine kinase